MIAGNFTRLGTHIHELFKKFWMRSRIVDYLAIFLFWNCILASQTLYAETGIDIDKLTLKSLSKEDQRIIEMGEIERGRYVLGGIVGSSLGLGIGHAIQGRYSSKGWFFTMGEVTSLGILIYGLHGGYFDVEFAGLFEFTVGTVGFMVFRIWEGVDLWVVPPIHNTRYRRIKKNLSLDFGENISLFIYPKGNDYIAMGLQMQF